MSLHPYLYFTNTTRDAMTTYQQILGGTLDIMDATALPEGDEPPFEMPDGFVVHAASTTRWSSVTSTSATATY